MANLGFSSGVVLGRSLPFERYGAEAGADASSGFLSSEALLAFFGGAFLSEPPDDERRRAGFGASSAFGGERAVSAGDVPFAFSAGFSLSTSTNGYNILRFELWQAKQTQCISFKVSIPHSHFHLI